MRADAAAQLNFGEVHKIVGGHPALGGWDPSAAPEMRWTDGDVWTLDIDVQPNEGLDFKARHPGFRVQGSVRVWTGDRRALQHGGLQV